MGILSSLFETRNDSTLAEPSEGLLSLFRGNRSTTGKAVNSDSAMTFSAVYACVRVLSESIASLPLPVYERLEKGKRRASDHYLYKLLHDVPNSEMTSFTFRETAMNHLLLEGNFYAEKEFDGGGRVVGLWPLNPHKTWCERINGELKYKSILPNGNQAVFHKDQIFHIPGMGFDGIKGYNPIRLAREAIGLGLAAEEYGARFFGNGAKPGGALEHPATLSDGARENLRESWNEMHQGLDKQHRIAILEEGMKYTQIGIAPEEAQFLETRKFQVTEVARFFRVPPHMLADLERATFSNIEQQSIDFVTHSLRPWLVRWEQAINIELFGLDSNRYFAEFVVDGLLRGDIKSRYEAYAIGVQNGFLSANDISEMENRNPIENGDVYLVPLNMIPVEQLTDPKSDLTDPETNTRGLPRREQRRQSQIVEVRRRLSRSYEKLLKKAFSNIIRQEREEIMKEAKQVLGSRNVDIFLDWISRFYQGFSQSVQFELTPIYFMLAETMKGEVDKEIGKEQGMTRELETFVTDYVTTLSSRHIGQSIVQIRNTLDKAGETGTDLLESLEEKFDSWESDRVSDEVSEEAVRATNALTKQSYREVGIRKLRWVADNEPCVFCQSLDGKIIDINGSFVKKDEDYQPEGAEAPMKPSRNVSHGPLHRGCECTIVSEREVITV